MIVNDFSLPVKQVRIDTYYFCLMLALVIPQIETLVAFVLSLRLHIVSGVSRIIWKQIGLQRVSRNPRPIELLKLTRKLVVTCHLR